MRLRSAVRKVELATGLVCAVAACGRLSEEMRVRAPLEFRMGWDAECAGCTKLEYENPAGRFSYYARGEPDLVLGPDASQRTTVFESDAPDWNVVIELEDDSILSLVELAERSAREADGVVLVSARGSTLGSFSSGSLSAAPRVLTFSYTSRARFDEAMTALGIRDQQLPRVTEADVLEACLRRAGTDEQKRANCTDHLDVSGDRRRLDRAEELQRQGASVEEVLNALDGIEPSHARDSP